MIFSLQFFNVIYLIDSFVHVEPFLHPRNISHFIMVYNPLTLLLNSVCKYFWGFFVYLCSLGILVCTFLVVFLSVFGIKVTLVSWNEFGSISFQREVRRWAFLPTPSEMNPEVIAAENAVCLIWLYGLVGASLEAQLVKNPPGMWETWVWSLEEGKATHSSILAWIIPWAV